MKKRLAQWLTPVALTLVASITTGCPGETPTPPPPTADIELTFNEAICAYYFAEGTDTSRDFYSFVLADLGDDAAGIEISFFSDTFEDVVSAIPATGTYNFSASGEKFTFDYAEYMPTVNTEDDEEEVEGVEAIGGSFAIARTGSEWRVHLFFELEDGKTVEGTYTGEVYQMPVPKNNVVADFNEMDYSMAGAKNIFADDLWTILLDGDTGDENTIVILNINTEAGLTEIPTGTFPMAAEPRKGVAGTAEPFSWLRTDDLSEIDMPPGCFYTYESKEDFRASYAVPGEGSVEISAEGKEYTIEFSFTGPNDKTISGSYTGYLMDIGDEPDPYGGTRAATRTPWRGIKRIWR
jgi:hypothetical protein